MTIRKSGSALRRRDWEMQSMAEVKQETGWRTRLGVTNRGGFAGLVPNWGGKVELRSTGQPRAAVPTFTFCLHIHILRSFAHPSAMGCAVAVELTFTRWCDDVSSRFSLGREWGGWDNFPDRRGF